MKITAFQIARQLAARHSALTGARPLFAADADSDRASLYVYETIGEDWWTGNGLTAKKVADALAQMKGKKAIDIFVNSPGGDIFEAKAIFAQLRRFEGEKVVHVDGIAASAASFIAMAGDKIITAPAATWMIHEVWTVAAGRASDLRATADLLDIENKTFAETYSKRTGRSVEEVLGWMSAETWMNAAEAKDRGFTDEIAEEAATDEAAVEAALRNATQTLRGLAG